MSEKVYTLSQVAALVGVNPPVIKYAHLTHKVPEPALRAGMHRLYSESELQNIKAYFAKRKELPWYTPERLSRMSRNIKPHI